jgi:RNA polymerase sigma factor (sigma-70 family)
MIDRNAWCRRLLDEHDKAIKRLVASVELDPDRRQDLVQDIWLAIWQALPRFRGECSERTFVYRIAHNRAVSHVQHWKIRRMEPLDAHEAVASGHPDPERALSARERQTQLQAAVQELPLSLRQIVVLMLEGLTHREASEVVGITEGNVAVRLSRAKTLLAAALAKQRTRHDTGH